MNVYAVIEERDVDNGGSADVVAIYDNEDMAEARVAELVADRDSGGRHRYYRPTVWWVEEYVLNQKDRWA